MPSRRKFLGNTLKSLASLAISPAGCGVSYVGTLSTVRLSRAAPASVPVNFVGLGCEMSSVAIPGLLSVTNRPYINLENGFGVAGVVCVGGIVADYTCYEGDGTSAWEPKRTVITRADLERFAHFLTEVGWSAIWNVNFAQGTLEEAVFEARAVADVLGRRLLALELGIEVDNYGRGEKPFRPAPHDYETYRAENNQWHAAIQKAVPGDQVCRSGYRQFH